MKLTLARICALQPSYSSENTDEMQERGVLIRRTLPEEIRDRIPELKVSFDSLFDDIKVEGSDGLGRKTQAPWVRIFSEAMSPNPREGFYIVIHFSASGDAYFITIGCGSTIWSGGDLRPMPDAELSSRTGWAKSVILQSIGTISPLIDQIELGSNAALPKTFEKATVCAKRVAILNQDLEDIEGLLLDAAKMLNAIYLAQIDQRDVSPGDQDRAQIDIIARPRTNPRRGQGRGLSAVERRQVELRAMALAIESLEKLGYSCEDCAQTQSFDLLAKRPGESIKVEVKGTTSDFCDSVLMTRNEVELHSLEAGLTALILVSGIKLHKLPSGEFEASGGSAEVNIGWKINDWTLEPVAYQVSRGRP